MNVSIDRFADAARIRFGAETPVPGESKEVAPGVRIDFDENGDAVAIEILGLRRRGLDPREISVMVSTADDMGVLPDDHPAHDAFARTTAQPER